MNATSTYTRRATRPTCNLVVRSGNYRDCFSPSEGETVEACIARRFAHCGGRLPEGWTLEIVACK